MFFTKKSCYGSFFWFKNMKYNTYSLPLKLDFDIPRQELNDLWPSFFSIGSCFAENQSNTLKKLGFSVYSNPFGIVYNPLSIERFFYRIAYKKEYTPQDFIHEKSYFSLEHHGHFKYTDEEKAIAKSNEILFKSCQAIHEAKTCIISLGTSIVYTLDDTPVANCHRLPNHIFKNKQLSYNQVLASLSNIVKHCKTANPNLSVIFTVSPIRHLKSGIINNNRSKAILIAAIHELIERLKHVDITYFPAYEIFIDELRDYRFSQEDLTHPTSQAQHYIWSRFTETYFSKSTREVINSVEQYLSYKNHVPTDIEIHSEKLRKLKQNLQKKYSFLHL